MLFSTLLCQEIGFPLPFFQMLVCNLYFVFICRPYKWLNLRQILPFTVYFTSWQWELHGFQRTWVFFWGGGLKYDFWWYIAHKNALPALLTVTVLWPGLSYYVKGLKAATEENTATIHSKCPCGLWNVNVLHTAVRTGHPNSFKLLYQVKNCPLVAI